MFPYIGRVGMADLTPAAVLAAIQRIKAVGKVETAHKTKHTAGQVFDPLKS